MATGDARATTAAAGRASAGPRGIDRILSRSIVYATLTGAIIVTYAASVVLLRSLLPGETPYAVALLSTGAAALVAIPLRDRLQRTVSRLLYGDRDDPDRADRASEEVLLRLSPRSGSSMSRRWWSIRWRRRCGSRSWRWS